MFQPIKIGQRISLPNRFLMSPIYLNGEADCKLESDDYIKNACAFFSERARHGAKLIVFGGVAPSLLGRWKQGSLSLTTWDTAQKLKPLTTSVHAEGGYIVAQAFHGGSSSLRRFRLGATSKKVSVHPYAEYSTIKIPGMLMNFVASEYERFAMLAEEAGFDGVEIPLSDGTLLHEFLSPSTNDRTDNFGGTLENRAELALRVLANIKCSLRDPDNFTVLVRLCTHDLKPGGSSMEETKLLAEMICGSGCVDLLTTSVGMHDSPVQTLASYVPRATFAKCTEIIREHLRSKDIDVPVAASHRINTIEVASDLVSRNVCDMVGICRPLLADSMFIEKVRDGKADSVVPCIGCNHCVNRLYKHQRVGCAVNPRSGFETDLSKNAPAVLFKKNVAVIGAGAAGVTCALTLAQRGHNVILYEKGVEIGGQLNLAKVVPGKGEYHDLLRYWTRRLQESTVKVRLNTDFTHRDASSGHQSLNAIVLCTGSIPRLIHSSHIPGASEGKTVVPFEKILNGSVTAGRRVVILGHGAIAYDVASYLLHDQRVSRSVDAYCVEWGVNLSAGTIDVHAQKNATKNNREVVLLNRTEKDADLARGKGWSQKLWLKNHGSPPIHSALIEKILPDGVQVSIIQPDNRCFFVPADTIVLASGMLPSMSTGTWVYEWVKDGAESRGQVTTDFGIYLAGSCRDAYSGDGHGEQDLMQVISEGYEIGCKV